MRAIGSILWGSRSCTHWVIVDEVSSSSELKFQEKWWPMVILWRLVGDFKSIRWRDESIYYCVVIVISVGFNVVISRDERLEINDIWLCYKLFVCSWKSCSFDLTRKEIRESGDRFGYESFCSVLGSRMIFPLLWWSIHARQTFDSDWYVVYGFLDDFLGLPGGEIKIHVDHFLSVSFVVEFLALGNLYSCERE